MAKLPPQPMGVPPGSSYWNDWYEKLRTFVETITTSVAWSIITGTPTTLAGYGITDGAAPANPSATVGLTAVNGTASTYLRSDGAPALNQTITPTWTGVHKYSFNGAALPAGVTGTMAQYGNADGVNTRMVMDAFAASSNVTGRRANTTAAAPSALASGDVIFSIVGLGYGSTAYSASSKAQVSFKANQAWTDANQGTRVEISTTPNGSTTQAIGLTVENSGGITVLGGITHGSATLLTTTVALTDGAAAAAGTLANAPAAGNPTKWIPINDNGTTRYIPAW